MAISVSQMIWMIKMIIKTLVFTSWWICPVGKEIEFDAASNPYIATSTTAECLALIFMIVVGASLAASLWKCPTPCWWCGYAEACVICYLECCKSKSLGKRTLPKSEIKEHQNAEFLSFISSIQIEKVMHVDRHQIFTCSFPARGVDFSDQPWSLNRLFLVCKVPNSFDFHGQI